MQEPDLTEVQNEMEQILSSETFKKYAVLSNFLRYVVTETLRGKGNELMEHTIAVGGLGRPSDFNPQIDTLIRLNAGRLRRLLVEYYKQEGVNDPVIISMTRGSYVPTFSKR